jgi:hypothetical protein
MCRYPLIYSIMVIPKSVTRVISLATQSTTTPAGQTLGFQVFYNLIGFVDVVMFFKTRRGLLLFDENLKPEKSHDERVNLRGPTDI